MSLLEVSSKGKSIKYKCNFCNKKIIGKLLPNQDGYEAVDLFEDIRFYLNKLDYSVDGKLKNYDIDISFVAKQQEYHSSKGALRKPISESVRHEVWRRDLGRCVKCGSKEKLEFDHIIPVSKGGSNTVRNIQLLCETCNRQKSNKI